MRGTTYAPLPVVVPLCSSPLTPSKLSVNQIRRMNFLTLPKAQRQLLVELGYRDKLDAVDEGIRRCVPLWRVLGCS